ncbi:MAG: ABC transporter ATP-binding protein [Thermoleophilia bacterium]|nr:ABC transporter ATP-binding protein [Thermoleophilia bacterium]
MDDFAIYLDGVTKRFGPVTAVERMDLGIARGEFFSLLGPSGCGKTTTLRMIAGFEEPSEGAIFLDGTDVAKLPPFRRNVNTVFQSYALFPHLNVEKNVAFGLKRKKLARHEIKRRVTDALRLVELEERRQYKPSQLSGGMQQRVALARALVNLPSVLLLDEPLGALDLKLRRQMQLELKHIHKDVGITFIYVTHDQEEALTMSDRIAVMNAGRVEQVGVPEDLYEHPATRFVAGFIGTSNFIEGSLERDGDHGLMNLGEGQRVLVPAAAGGSAGGPVELAVRPEKIRLYEVGQEVPEGLCLLRGKVRDVVYLGMTTQYTIEVPVLSRQFTVLEQNVEAASDQTLWVPGEETQLAWHPSHNRVLPAEGSAGAQEEDAA